MKWLFSFILLASSALAAPPAYITHPTASCTSAKYLQYTDAVTPATCKQVVWADLASTPTTLVGYGITDAQARVTGTCASGNAIRVINADGTVTCQSASGGGGGGGTWGSITGTLSDQTDLQAALDLKVPTARTINTHALSANVTLTASDVGADASGAASTAQTNAEAYTDSSVAPYLLGATAASTYQPLDSDLTAIAALTTTSNGRGFLALADAAAGRTYLALGSLATQSGTFSGTSSGTNTGDQTTISGNAGTATALAANGTNCSAGSFPLGVDASGNSESCTAVSTAGLSGVYTDLTSLPTLPVTIAQVSHKWLDSYTSGTGLFTASRPACADLSDAGSGCSSSGGSFVADETSLHVSGTTFSLKAGTGDCTWLAGATATTCTKTSGVAFGSLATLSVAPTATALATARTIALTGDVTWTSPSFDGSGNVTAAATLANIPTATPAAGSILYTAITAPSTPAAGKGAVYVDSTSKNIAVKDDAGVVKHGVQTKTGTANQFVTAISDTGAVTTAQPSASNLSDGTTGSGGAVVLATGPTLSNPIVGTQSPGDNSTKAASTAYVDSADKGTTTVTGATDLTYSGLDLNTDKYYQLFGSFKCASGTPTVSLFFNSDNTAANYDHEFTTASGSTLSTSNANAPSFYTCAAGDSFNFTGTLFVDQDGKPRIVVILSGGSTTGLKNAFTSIMWRTGSTNVTGLIVHSSVANGLSGSLRAKTQ